MIPTDWPMVHEHRAGRTGRTYPESVGVPSGASSLPDSRRRDQRCRRSSDALAWGGCIIRELSRLRGRGCLDASRKARLSVVSAVLCGKVFIVKIRWFFFPLAVALPRYDRRGEIFLSDCS